MRNIAILLFSFASLQAQTYCAGDQVSLDHQNIEHVVGAGHEDYIAGDTFRLSDWNGDLNGGNYHIIFIDMSASWWGPCQSNAPIVDGLEEIYAEMGVKFVTSLSDPGQPYSCEAWQSSFGNADVGIAYFSGRFCREYTPKPQWLSPPMILRLCGLDLDVFPYTISISPNQIDYNMTNASL